MKHEAFEEKMAKALRFAGIRVTSHTDLDSKEWVLTFKHYNNNSLEYRIPEYSLTNWTKQSEIAFWHDVRQRLVQKRMLT